MRKAFQSLNAGNYLFDSSFPAKPVNYLIVYCFLFVIEQDITKYLINTYTFLYNQRGLLALLPIHTCFHLCDRQRIFIKRFPHLRAKVPLNEFTFLAYEIPDIHNDK